MGVIHNDAEVAKILGDARFSGSLSSAAQHSNTLVHSITNIDYLYNPPTKAEPTFRSKEDVISNVVSLVTSIPHRKFTSAYYDLDATTANGHVPGIELTISTVDLVPLPPIRSQMVYAKLRLDREAIVEVADSSDVDRYKTVCNAIIDNYVGKSIILGPNNNAQSIQSIAEAPGLTKTIASAAPSAAQAQLYLEALYEMRKNCKDYHVGVTLYITTDVLECITAYAVTDNGQPLYSESILGDHLRCNVVPLNIVSGLTNSAGDTAGAVMCLPKYYELYRDEPSNTHTFDINYNSYTVVGRKHVHGRSSRPETTSVMYLNV